MLLRVPWNMSCQCVNVAQYHRICKAEIITDFEREVKKMKEVKIYSSRHPSLLQQLETFLLVKFPLLVFNCTKHLDV